jgi:carboxypeptidase C (cathepsin A)
MVVGCRGCFAGIVLLALTAGFALPSAASAQEKADEKIVVSGAPSPMPQTIAEPDSTTEGTVTVDGQAIAYKAVAGTLTVGATDAEDAALGFDGKLLPDSGVKPPANPADAPATARMFYVAYFKKDSVADHRPVTFIYNGGPGSPTMWLHLGTFGPRRVVVPDTEHQEGAPYTIVRRLHPRRVPWPVMPTAWKP